MDMKRVVGVVVLAMGRFSSVWPTTPANAPMEGISDAVTGRYSGEAMSYFGVGIAAVVGGLPAVFGRRE